MKESDDSIFVTLSTKTETGELVDIEMNKEISPCCQGCGSSLEDHEIINYKRICYGWSKGDVQCKLCKSIVRHILIIHY
ncbi:MAG: hypothetical protein PHX25_02900 [Candidatus Pacebacteria bacterium]|nr:hypothetical protein [Candidatus Paceibacterota bacterium]